jgi:DinB superfamily
VNVAPQRDELVALSDRVWQRLLDRLDGLADDEYFWEPVPGRWTVRAGPGGVWPWDYAWPEPDRLR